MIYFVDPNCVDARNFRYENSMKDSKVTSAIENEYGKLLLLDDGDFFLESLKNRISVGYKTIPCRLRFGHAAEEEVLKMFAIK